jgi:twitching motility protein PilT
MDLRKIFDFAAANEASDIHIQALLPPMMRIAGRMRSVDSASLSNEQVLDLIASIGPQMERDKLPRLIFEGLDFSHSIEGLGRFRCSAYCQLGNVGIVMRVIRETIPTFEALNLPSCIKDIALARRGLTLVTGTTGSGKSTTLAAMIDLINNTYPAKIITIEDPVEYIHRKNKALISQLEVGIDTPSYSQALRQALRQDPDVILIGELRDVESLRIALHAADTGHQVYSTVHSANSPQTIERIIAMFPPAEHELLLSQLAGSIEAIISQRLLTTHEGKRVPAVEILRGGGVTKKFIMEKKLAELTSYIQTREIGMQTFDQHILEIFNKELISGTEALRWASNPEALAMAMRGIGTLGN